MNHFASAQFRRLPLNLAIGLALAACAVDSAQAATRTFTGANGALWSSTGSWASGLLPVNGDTAVVGGSGAPRTVNFDAVMTGTGLSILNLDYASIINQSLSTSVMIARTERIGSSQPQTSTYNQSGGSNTASGMIIGGNQGAGTGIYNLSGGTLNIGTAAEAGAIFVGYLGFGSFHQSAGVTTVLGTFSVGYAAGVTSTVTLSGGSFSVRDQTTIGQYGTGSFTQSSGKASLGGLLLGNEDKSLGKGIYILNSADGMASLSSSWVDLGLGEGSGSFTQSGDTTHQVAGQVRVGKTGSYTLNGGTLSAGSLNIETGGVVTLAGGQLQVGSVSLSGQVSVGQGSTLTTTAQLSNTGSLQLAGGSLSGAGILFNSSELTGYGRIDGTGGFINDGLLTQSGGTLVLGNTGDNENRGSWNLLAGRQLELSGAYLDNSGQLNLNGGFVVGRGTLTNANQGTVSGSGRIAANFYNAGTLVVDKGQTLIDNSFTNRGQILLGGNTATLAGGQIGNHGLIQGLGRINSDISNIDPVAVIEAQGGTLTLAGRFVSANGGTLAVGSGAKLLISQGLLSNAGQIQLAGGTLDNNGRGMVNEAGASINGFGTLRAGTLTNQGQIFLSGGTSALRADIVAAAGSQIILSGLSNTTFYGKLEVQNGAELRVSEGSVATFAAEVKQRTGADVNGDGKMLFEGGLSIGNSPGYGYIQGSVTFAGSNTYTAEIGGINACTTLSCAAGAPLVNDSFDKLAVGGKLTMGGKLVLTSWNGYVAQAGQHFDLLDWGTTSGVFKSIDASGFLLATGTKLDYSELYSTGTISVTAVPEPGSWALMLAGLGTMGGLARRRRVA
ncbi:hypothetical protein BH11PSE9_BH11PSE9_19780 [soil metagenome]